MKRKVILHLCADIGSDSKPYVEAGYDVIRVGRDIGVENYQPPVEVYGIIANPPCTMFSIARTCAKTPRDLEDGMRLVKECLRIIWECQYRTPERQRTGALKFWALENPGTGLLRHFLGKPAYEYCPHEFGAPFTKRTALWGYFNAPKKPFMQFPIVKTYSLASGKKDCPTSWTRYTGTHEEKKIQCTADRSMCYEPFARAFYEANQ